MKTWQCSLILAKVIFICLLFFPLPEIKVFKQVEVIKSFTYTFSFPPTLQAIVGTQKYCWEIMFWKYILISTDFFKYLFFAIYNTNISHLKYDKISSIKNTQRLLKYKNKSNLINYRFFMESQIPRAQVVKQS